MRAAPTRPEGSLFIDVQAGLTLFIGRGLTTSQHQHFTASLTFALDGPMRVHTPLANVDAVGCMALAPDATHALLAESARVVNIQVDPESERFTQLAPLGLKRAELKLYRWDELAAARDELNTLLGSGDEPNVQAVWDAAVRALGGAEPEHRRFEPRVQRTIAALKLAFPAFPRVAELAAAVGLSEGRLIRLFSAQVGVPLRRYMLWLRLRHVMFSIASGGNFTDAAHAAGFADSAHLTRVFREMFGIAPSLLLKSPGVNLRVVVPPGQLHGPHAESDQLRLAQLAKHVLRER